MSRLLDLLAPEHSRDKHTTVAELIKGIISMAAPSPASGLGDGPGAGIASNRFARELASPASVAKLVGYILTDYKPPAQDTANSTSEEDAEKLPNHAAWKPAVHTNRLAQRQLALYMCAWSLAEDDLARAVRRWEKEHRHTQAACWLVFTKQYRAAGEVLMRSKGASGALFVVHFVDGEP